MNDVLDPILRTPKMRILMNDLEVRWRNEQRLREQFYHDIQPGDKWEFINGEKIMHSPAKEKHTEARKSLSMLLQIYTVSRDLGKTHDETSLVSLTRNDYLPDILFFKKERAAAFKPDTWQYPIPDFIVEVLSDSTEQTDRTTKMEDYAAHGALEYWLVDTDQQSVEQYLLDEASNTFRLYAKKTIKDQIESQVISGFDIPVAAIFDEKLKLELIKTWL
jgi:Uma2 family endonuclease